MTVRHMRIFCAVCENDCSTTKAAAQLNMSQPAVSLAVKELENYYEVRLFDRIGRRLSITSAGEIFLRYARRILALFSGVEREMRDWNRFGKLRIGASLTIGGQLLPRYVGLFKKCHPEAEIDVLVAPSSELEQKVLDNELDFALVEGTMYAPAIVSIPYMTDSLAIVCAADGMYRQGQIIDLEELQKHILLLRNKGSGPREIFERACREKGFVPTAGWESISTSALLNAASQGLGLAVLPYRLVEQQGQEGRVVTVQVAGLDLRREFSIIKHKDKDLTASAEAFIQLCRDCEAEIPLPAGQLVY